ncbi:MAG: IcmT/TraK family protein [Pseudobdellovibrionaceae bacterium]
MAVNQIADLKEQVNWHWRNTMRPIRFFNFDSRAIIPWCILLFHVRWSTLILVIVMTILFQILEKKGLTFDAALRSLRPIIFGPYRPGIAKFRYRTLKDFGR